MTAWPIKKSITALVTVLLILLISLGGNAAWQESLITFLKSEAKFLQRHSLTQLK